MAQGSRFAGYSLYVKDGRLHYVHNYLGLQEHRVSSTEPLPTGPATLRFVFSKTGEHRGSGALYVNDREVGAGEIPQTVPNLFDHAAEGLCCGYDSGAPVTDDYRAPFRFTGTIKRVVVLVDGPQHDDSHGPAPRRVQEPVGIDRHVSSHSSSAAGGILDILQRLREGAALRVDVLPKPE